VKPANVMLEPVTLASRGRQYRAVLADFGLVKIAEVSTQMTTSAGVMGTLDYIAPEQIEAEPRLDGRADIYALGAMTYEMLTGTQPFKASNALAVLMMHMHEPPPDPQKLVPELPDNVSAAIRRAMAKKPDHRYATAGEFSAALS
jgi:eukaryotic-like serine/threonine-protein kinase